MEKIGNNTMKNKIYLIIYSPSPEYPAACCRDERQGEPRRSSSERRRVNFAISFHVGIATAQFRFDTQQLAAGSFIWPIIETKITFYAHKM